MAPEQNVYTEEEASPFAQYLEENRGEVSGTAHIRMHSTAEGVLDQTEEVIEVLEELEKASYVQRIEDNPEDRWRISPYADSDDILNYLTDEKAHDRSHHPLGPDFNEEDITGSLNMKELFQFRAEEYP
ncbi:MAG: hypothetical protein ABEK10_03890 [Candidatus Nanosalina sp.]